MSKMKEVVARPEYREESYRVLADCYYLPDHDLLRKLGGLGGSPSEFLRELAGNLQIHEGIELLQVDYTALFVGPYGLLAPPYGSLYLETKGTLMGESTMEVGHRYLAEHLDLNIKEAPDHIAVELEFMHFLAHMEATATLNSDPVAAADYAEKQRDFLGTHLCQWIHGFSQKVRANSRTRFYRRLADLTETFVVSDFESLPAVLPLALTRKMR